MPDPRPINIETKPEASVATSRKANWWLIVLGLFLVAIFVAGIVYSRDTGSETFEKSTPAAGQGQAKATEKTTKTKSVPSETLLTAILGTGAALIVVGALYGRISTIKLPGGSEITLSSEEKQETAVKVGERLKEKEREQGTQIDPVETAKLTQEANDRLLRAKAYATVELPKEKIATVVDDIVEQSDV